ncbi:MAG: endonuclease III [Elusimicrobia bacterium]|nr:endonuclease III [Elusimicrobiota bacterium]
MISRSRLRERGEGEKRIGDILKGLKRLYPNPTCELDFKSPLQLLMATILSAQCTDKRVNMVTPALFKKYPDAKSLAAAEPSELEAVVRTTGFFRAKAKSIRETARLLVERFGGKVPRTMEELLVLRGVARKTANVVLGTAYGIAEGVVVDTHVKRLSFRLGLSEATDPVKIERDLMALVPRKDWIFFGHAMTWHGRRVCFAVSPNCPGCLLNTVCPKRGV